MNLKNHLKSQGWTDEQIAAAFADPNSLQALDTIFGTVTSERDAAKALNDKWQEKLEKEYQPAITKAEQDAFSARRQAADLQEQLKIAKEYGYLDDDAAKRAEDAAAAARARSNPDFDPRKHNLVTMDDVAKFADAEGEAIMLATDLAAQYQHYTGKSVFEYEAQINGQTLSGMRALRQEAKAARKPLDQYVAEKFDFVGKRQAKTAEVQAARDEQIRKEEREKTQREMADRFGNPALASAVPSRVPFTPSKSADGKHPWERGTARERQVERIKRAATAQITTAVQ